MRSNTVLCYHILQLTLHLKTALNDPIRIVYAYRRMSEMIEYFQIHRENENYSRETGKYQ